MPIARFIGASNAMIVNPITKKSEVFYDFVLRHSLYRPRDLMLIGGKIAQIPAGLRTQERLRAAVDQAAGEIVWHYLAEMRGLTEVPDRSLFGLIPSNVLDRSALKRIAETYVARLKEKGLDAFEWAPFLRSVPPRSLGSGAPQPRAKRHPGLSAAARNRTRRVHADAARGAALPDPPRP